MRIERRESKGLNCVGCGERVRSCEKYLQVVRADTGRAVRGERYCLRCEDIARENNDIVDGDTPSYDRGERMREEYASYRAAGCTSAFFDDMQAGYIG